MQILRAANDRLHRAHLLLAHGAVHAVAQQPRVAEHGVERRAKLVGHRGEEARFDLVRLEQRARAMRELLVRGEKFLANARVFVGLCLGALVRALVCARERIAPLVELEGLADEPPHPPVDDDVECARLGAALRECELDHRGAGDRITQNQGDRFVGSFDDAVGDRLMLEGVA